MTLARDAMHNLDYDGDHVPFKTMRDFLAENDGNYWFRAWDNDTMNDVSHSGIMMVIFEDKSCLSFMAFRKSGSQFFTFHSPRVLTNNY